MAFNFDTLLLGLVGSVLDAVASVGFAFVMLIVQSALDAVRRLDVIAILAIRFLLLDVVAYMIIMGTLRSAQLTLPYISANRVQIVVVSRNVLAAERTMMIFWDCRMHIDAHLSTFMMIMMPVTTPGMLVVMVAVAV